MTEKTPAAAAPATEVLYRGPRLLVPLTVEAFVVVHPNHPHNRFIVQGMEYGSVGEFNPVTHDFAGDTEMYFKLLVDEVTTGATIHWALPDALTHGREVRATAEAELDDDGGVKTVELIDGGSGYQTAPRVRFESGGSGATAVAEVDDETGAVTGVTMIRGGSGYKTAPTVTIFGAGQGARAEAAVSERVVTGVTLLAGGGGYKQKTTTVEIEPEGGGTGAAATATIDRDGKVEAIEVGNPGSGYPEPPRVVVDPGEDIAYPFAPNRWLIVRFCTDATVPEDKRKSRAWVVQSDYLNMLDGTNQFLKDDERVYMGRVYELDQWPGEGPEVEPLFLHAVGPGEPAFAAYVAGLKNVFAFNDPLAGLEGTPGRFTYLVTGWYSNPQSDPLYGRHDYGKKGWQTGAQWRALMAASQWSVGDERDLDAAVDEARKWLEDHCVPPLGTPHDRYPAQVLCAGMVYGVNWLGKDGLAQTRVPTLDARRDLAIGNTAKDALAVLPANSDDETPADEGRADADFLAAAQNDLLPVLDGADPDPRLDYSLDETWYGSSPGGTRWEVFRPTGEDGFTLTPEQARLLGCLNQGQRRLDRRQRQLVYLQRELHGTWWKYHKRGRLPLGVPEEQWDEIQERVRSALDIETDDSLIDAVERQMQAIDDASRELDDLFEELEKNHVYLPPDEDDALRDPQAGPGGEGALFLKAVAMPRFFEPNEPAVLLQGACRAHKHGEDGRFSADDTLLCRFTGQAIRRLRITPAGDPEPVYVTAEELLEEGLPDIPTLGKLIPKEAASLCVEVFFLDATKIEDKEYSWNAMSLAKCAFKKLTDPPPVEELAEQIFKQQTGCWNADVHLSLDRHAVVGVSGMEPVLPSLVAVSCWSQPWTPLYMAWNYKWCPTYEEPRQALGDWSFNGRHYEFSGSALGPGIDGFKGHSILTPNAGRVLQEKLEKTFAGEGEDPELAHFLVRAADADLLSQALSGMNDVFVGLLGDQFNPLPTQFTVDGGSEERNLKALVGGEGRLRPEPDAIKRTFFPIRAGHVKLLNMRVLDAFGQVFDFLHLSGNAQLVPKRGRGLVTPARVPSHRDYVQLPPRLLQPARQLFRFIPASLESPPDDPQEIPFTNPSIAATNPVCGWLLPNHVDRSLMVYDAAGALLGDLRLTGSGDSRRIRWQPVPGSPAAVGAPPDIDNPYLLGFVNGLLNRREEPARAFDNLLRVIDETLWTVEPPGERGNQHLSVLVGRPLAMVRAMLQFELDADPIKSQSWHDVISDDPSHSFEQVEFAVALGDLSLLDDGVIGYFRDGEEPTFGRFNALHCPPDPLPERPYVVQQGAEIDGVKNYVRLSFEGSRVAYLTLLVDPRAKMHAASGVLPVKSIVLPDRFVEEAMARMEVTFRVGPSLIDPRAVRIPQPGGVPGRWSWIQRTGVTVWEDDAHLDQADAQAQLADRPPTLNEGWLRLAPIPWGTALSEPGFAQEISVGADGTVWVVGARPAGQESGNAALHWYGRGADAWKTAPAPAAGVRVAAAPDGKIWTIDAGGKVQEWTIGEEHASAVDRSAAGFATEISVGPDGTVWIISTQEHGAGGFVLKFYDSGQSWTTVPGGAAGVQVAGAPCDNDKKAQAWVVTAAGEVAVWTQAGDRSEIPLDPLVPGTHKFALGVGVDVHGTARIVSGQPQTGDQSESDDTLVKRYNPQAEAWVTHPHAAAVRLASAPDGSFRTIDAKGVVQIWN